MVFNVEFQSNCLNNDDSLKMKLLHNDQFHFIQKGNELLVKKLWTFTVIGKMMVLI